MSIFENFFNRKKVQTELESDKSKQVCKSEASSFQELLEQHAGLSFEKQSLFGQVIGSSSWQFDMNEGLISFGELEFPIQIIGSLSFNDNSWLWGWANTKSGLPDRLLVQANRLKEIGKQKDIQELNDAHYSVDEGFEHKVGMVACGIFEAKSYYCANYGQGTLIVTIDDDRVPEVDRENFEAVLTIFPQLISSIDLNHKEAFKNYLIDRGFIINEFDMIIEGEINGRKITGKFDHLGRLISLKG